MNRKTWVWLIVGVAVVGVLAFAVRCNGDSGAPKLKVLAGTKPAFHTTEGVWPTDVYVVPSGRSAARKSVVADLKSLGFAERGAPSGASVWLHSGWIVRIFDGEVEVSKFGDLSQPTGTGSPPAGDSLTVAVSQVREPTLLDRLKFWLGR